MNLGFKKGKREKYNTTTTTSTTTGLSTPFHLTELPFELLARVVCYFLFAHLFVVVVVVVVVAV